MPAKNHQAEGEGKREVSGYKLYRDVMDKLVEVAKYRKVNIADLLDPVLQALMDAEYESMLNEKLAEERERRRALADLQKQKQGKK